MVSTFEGEQARVHEIGPAGRLGLPLRDRTCSCPKVVPLTLAEENAFPQSLPGFHTTSAAGIPYGRSRAICACSDQLNQPRIRVVRYKELDGCVTGLAERESLSLSPLCCKKRAVEPRERELERFLRLESCPRVSGVCVTTWVVGSAN